MVRVFVIVMLAGMAIAPLAVAGAQSNDPTDSHPAAKAEDSTGDLPPLPTLPRGKSTVMGGEIRKVDPVLDQLTLKAYGEKPIKIFFDERTQVFRDGKKIPLIDLQPVEHAAVQTVLDGTAIFALSIHELSRSPEGDYQGKVTNFNPGSGELTLAGVVSGQSLKILVTAGTQIARQGQSAFSSAGSGQSDLVRGALISVKFQSDTRGRGVASAIAVLAIPGSTFVFSGSLASFDMHAGLLVLADPRDSNNYPISFDPARFPVSQNFHPGEPLRVTANFDGTRYVASDITISQAPQ